MHKRKPHSTSLVLLLVCIFTIWWGISVLAQHDASGPLAAFNKNVPAQATATTTQEGSPLVVSETYANGAYTYSGTYMPASPCDSFGSGVRFSQVNGGQVSILLSTAPSPTACAQAYSGDTGEPFSVSVKSKLITAPQFDGVFLNGNPIPSQLIEEK